VRTGELPVHDHGHVDGLDSERTEDLNWFAMDDDLHPQDIKHHHHDKGDQKP
jgi:C4-dicarboxylate transporter DctQ subunit